MDTTPQLMYLTWSPMTYLLLIVLVMVFFGKGKVSDFMGDIAKGIKAFKKGMAEDEVPSAPASAIPTKSVDHDQVHMDTRTASSHETKI